MSTLGKIFIAVAILLYGGHVNAGASCNLYFIDAHSQIDHKVSGELSNVTCAIVNFIEAQDSHQTAA